MTGVRKGRGFYVYAVAATLGVAIVALRVAIVALRVVVVALRVVVVALGVAPFGRICNPAALNRGI